MILQYKLLASATTLCAGGGGSNSGCSIGLPKTPASSGEIQTVLQILFGIVAAIAVLIIVINGLRLVLSQGNPEQVRKSRDAVLGAVIGLVIALSAEVIVAFVLGKL